MKSKNAVYNLIPVILAAADQFIKQIIRQRSAGEVLLKVDGIAEIVCSQNTGAAFSILSGKTGMLSIFSALLLGCIVYFAFCCMTLSPAGRIAVLCLIGGGLGNLTDRMLYGYVTDYIRLTFIEFPVFNFADVIITCSVGFLIILLFSDRLERCAGEEHGRHP